MRTNFVKRWLNRKAAQMVEEGLLIGIALIAMTLLVSMIGGILSYVENTFKNSQNTLENFIVEVLGKDLDKLWNETVKIFGG
ncbi:MAG TPA: hypothetical protein ENF87_00155 [Thermoproteales archaeon]|nr:hypothetical protein [Thermoproteales archaeon]